MERRDFGKARESFIAEDDEKSEPPFVSHHSSPRWDIRH
jgi:hypothetical protein